MTRPLWDGGPCSLCPHVVLERMQSQQLLPTATAHPRPRARSVHITVAVCLLRASGPGSSCTSSGEIHRSSPRVSLPRQPGPSLRCRASPAGPGRWCGQHRVRSRVLAGGRLLPWRCAVSGSRGQEAGTAPGAGVGAHKSRPGPAVGQSTSRMRPGCLGPAELWREGGEGVGGRPALGPRGRTKPFPLLRSPGAPDRRLGPSPRRDWMRGSAPGGGPQTPVPRPRTGREGAGWPGAPGATMFDSSQYPYNCFNDEDDAGSADPDQRLTRPAYR